MSQRLWLVNIEQDALVAEARAKMVVPNQCTHSTTSSQYLMKVTRQDFEQVAKVGRTSSMSRKRNQRRLRRIKELQSESISNLILIEALRVRYIQLIRR